MHVSNFYLKLLKVRVILCNHTFKMLTKFRMWIIWKTDTVAQGHVNWGLNPEELIYSMQSLGILENGCEQIYSSFFASCQRDSISSSVIDSRDLMLLFSMYSNRFLNFLLTFSRAASGSILRYLP